ncbi:TrbC family F-type conjugative pilus assembly protein [Pseudoalteromonas sp. SK20]|uniref:TrbC family F-type conjugative pilus assembly protein n=1 Tax=Pseudoalteromonas sp. SK20 TaxID=1938367 RepID=UPI00097786B3|nr:TrbC family F-type conjugative pilus assembly protein [Pseudoalteromonas sp. SK20]
MQFFKLLPLVAIFSCTANAETVEQHAQKAKEEAVNSLKAVDLSKSPFEIPEKMKEKFRQAAQNKGDFSLPDTSQKAMQELTPAQREQMRVAIDKVKAKTEEMKKKGWLDPFAEKAVNKNIEQYRKSAQMLSEQSTSSLERALHEEAGLTKEQASNFNAGSNMPESRQNEANEKAVFISFSMDKNTIEDIIYLAKEQGAEVYLNGLHPSHKMINETMMLLRNIVKGIQNPPIVRFNPTAFKKYDINSVPTILYRELDKYITASGVTSFEWLEEQYEKHDESFDYGIAGPVSEVAEKSIIEEMKERMADYDWKAERKRTIDTYWQRQSFTTLPRATRTEEWLIDPTIKASKDIKTPRGELIAKQGAVMNPLKGHGVGFTTVVFNATDIKQVEWASQKLNSMNSVGQLMLITSEVSKTKGWKHIEAIQNQFKQKIYLMPKELASRFQLSGLPAVVKTDLKKSMLHVTQFNINEED